MEREIVKSSSIKSVGYDENKSILEIEFLNETVYDYFDVPKIIFLELKGAESKGKFYNKIKDKFRFEKNKPKLPLLPHTN